MPTIEQSIEVNVPVRTAYNQWTQFEEFPEFMEGVEYVHQIDDTHLRWKAEVAGKSGSGGTLASSRLTCPAAASTGTRSRKYAVSRLAWGRFPVRRDAPITRSGVPPCPLSPKTLAAATAR